MLTDYAESVPIFWGHGTDDPVVRHEVGLDSTQFLKAQGIPIASEIGAQGLSFRFYQGVGHTTDDVRELPVSRHSSLRLCPICEGCRCERNPRNSLRVCQLALCILSIA